MIVLCGETKHCLFGTKKSDYQTNKFNFIQIADKFLVSW